jgi:KipI family sensor histidine kinase inhibitor
MTAGAPRLLLAGDTALTVEFGDAIDPAINARVLALDRALEGAALPGMVERVPTYRSLQIHYDPDLLPTRDLVAAVERLASGLASDAPAGRRWTVPVAYGGDLGIDLDAVAERTGLSAEQVVARHLAGDYRVYMIGFQPGFTYLGGLDDRLHLPRRDSPRLKTPAGTISIGGIQAAVASIEAPSGWHLLGRTPVRAFDPARAAPFLFATGDRIRFERIDPAGFASLSRRVAEEGWTPPCEAP